MIGNRLGTQQFLNSRVCSHVYRQLLVLVSSAEVFWVFVIQILGEFVIIFKTDIVRNSVTSKIYTIFEGVGWLQIYPLFNSLGFVGL